MMADVILRLSRRKTRNLSIFEKNILSIASRQIAIATGYQPGAVERLRRDDRLEVKPAKIPRKNEGRVFTMILPPPNVTGDLHLGHSLMCTIQDVICRRKKHLGDEVIWVPGTDHAGIATQVVVEKKLLKECSQSRKDLGRERFLQEVWKWKNEKESNILEDLKKIGATLDWELEYFTMDKAHSDVVVEAFVRLFEKGLITRRKSLVNWSCTLESTISDIEVKTIDINGETALAQSGYVRPVTFGRIYDIAYKVCGSECEDEIIVSTTRPETLLGDTAIAVHPNDERFSRFHERSAFVWHPFREERIPIILDESVDRDFGTGAVKITPAHDKSDFSIAQKHALQCIEIFDEKGRVQMDGDFVNLPRFDCREKIIEKLTKMNLLRDMRTHAMQLPLCSRTNDIIEYMLREQWYLDCSGMAQKAYDAVKNGQLKIQPNNFEHEWFRWLSDCKDWCISRQLWWGHRIPAYLCSTSQKTEWIAAANRQEAVQKAKRVFKAELDEISINQDNDVLDTWFSSALLPFSVFGWPHNLQSSYPLDLMETGHDILFFWVARMVMLGQELTERLPFNQILLHGIVCDAHGRKMSKSLGNVILPDQIINGASFESMQAYIRKSYETGIITADEVDKSTAGLKKDFPDGIKECGTDALRFTLCSHNLKNHFINFDVSECYTNRIFFNKIWQATRYTLASCAKFNLSPSDCTLDEMNLTLMDKWILSKLSNTIELCDRSFESFNLHKIVNALKVFFYTNFCDIYLETTKSAMQPNSPIGKSHCSVLSFCLSRGLQTMSPITPFLCTELLQYFPKIEELDHKKFLDTNLETEVDTVLEVCAAIRQQNSQHQISRKHQPKVFLFANDSDALDMLRQYQCVIKTLTLSYDVFIELDKKNSKINQNFNIYSTGNHLCSFGIQTNEKFRKMSNSVDLNKNKLDKLEEDLNKLQKIVSSDGYKKKASSKIQQKHMEKVTEHIDETVRNRNIIYSINKLVLNCLRTGTK